jgi:hypothetical protein
MGPNPANSQMNYGLGVHRRQGVLHSGSGVNRSMVSAKISVAGGHFWSLLLQNFHKHVQYQPDEHNIYHGPLYGVIGVDSACESKKTMILFFFL